ncbi:CbrC family protein [Streptomyces sp. NPDC057362]|uniref:CbrC family protein n=1 Tax=Streptomyces sp. NPDC057362 TaxID=3346106 RepID=UPI00362E72C7
MADGSAAAKYDAHFIGDPIGDDVPLEVVMSVDACTPGFSSWQNPRWFFHCGEGKAFMGVVGAVELAADTWRTWTSRSRGQAAAATSGSNRWRRHSGGPSSGAARQGCSRGGCGGGPGR